MNRVPISEGLLTKPLQDLSAVRLAGTRCTNCGETVLGTKELCMNCGRDSVEGLALSERGTLWTYTVVRHRPPGNYRGPQDFVPFGLGLVELPEGLRILAPLTADPTSLRIGMPMRLQISVCSGPDESEVVVFSFTTDLLGAGDHD